MASCCRVARSGHEPRYRRTVSRLIPNSLAIRGCDHPKSTRRRSPRFCLKPPRLQSSKFPTALIAMQAQLFAPRPLHIKIGLFLLTTSPSARKREALLSAENTCGPIQTAAAPTAYRTELLDPLPPAQPVKSTLIPTQDDQMGGLHDSPNPTTYQVQSKGPHPGKA